MVSLLIAVKLPKSQQLIITYGLNVLKSTGEFDTSLTTLYNLAPADNTWHDFKTHFTNAYDNILKIKGKKMKNTHYLQTNKEILHFTVEFAQMGNKVLNSINGQDLLQEPSLTSTYVTSVIQTQSINSTTQNDTNELKKIILNYKIIQSKIIQNIIIQLK